jgi:hypothetical protein
LKRTITRAISKNHQVAFVRAKRFIFLRHALACNASDETKEMTAVSRGTVI